MCVIAIVHIIVTSRITKRNNKPLNDLLAENESLRKKILDVENRLNSSEKRRKNLLSINKGERALIPNYPLSYEQGTKDEISFKATYEVDVLDVTNSMIKVSPYSVITDNNGFNRNQQKLQEISNFLKDKWVDISSCQPILDTQVRREDKLEELEDIFNQDEKSPE